MDEIREAGRDVIRKVDFLKTRAVVLIHSHLDSFCRLTLMSGPIVSQEGAEPCSQSLEGIAVVTNIV